MDVVATDVMYQARTEKNIAEKLALQRLSVDNASSGVTITVTSQRGIENMSEHSMCWLIAVVQVVCGTTFYNLLPPLNTQLMASLESIRIELSLNTNSPVIMAEDIQSIANICKIGVGGQKDSKEFFQKLIELTHESSTQNYVMFNQCDVQTCTRCGTTISDVLCRPFFTVEVLPSNYVLDLQSLIWNTATGCYDYKNDSRLLNRCQCDNNEATIHTASFLGQAPSILVIDTKHENHHIGGLAQ